MSALSSQSVYDVMTAGAGPVGLFVACELALAKCSVLILEKADNPHSPLEQLPFGIRGLSTPTIEALYRRGLLEEFKVPQRLKNPFGSSPAAQGQQSRQAGHFAGIQFQHSNIDTAQWKYRLPSSTNTHLVAELEEVEAVLARRAEALGVKIRRGVAISGMHQNREGVSVASGDQTFQSQWLVGCDGSRSVIRKTAGFEFAGTEPEFTGYSTKVDIADPEKLEQGRNLTATGLYFQLQPDYLVMQEFDGRVCHTGKPITLEHVQKVLRRISNTDVTINALHIATTWTDRARQATAYRNERVLLAGDAAHIHAPLGGQGLNLGLGDAMNLGRKLAATIHKKAPEGLLDSYHVERHPVGAQVLDWSRAQVAVMKPGPPARALNAILRDIIDTRDGATYFAAKVWGVSTHYDLGGGHPLVGHSVPNFEWEDGTKIGEFMRHGQGILLDFTASAFLKTMASSYGEQMTYICKRAKEPLGLSAALIRPDGYIAWACDQEPNAQQAGRAAALWFTRSL